mmetsp:Transcript_37259/g.41527  ORF Transcript_37259/g.41527 Transcript_37259/m.41527 type:complete len:513 (-) Transcript_37259:471-2009(-)
MIPRTIPMRSVQSIKRQRQRQRREEEEEADDRTDNAEKEEEEEEEDYDYDQVIRGNEIDRDKHDYQVSKIITQADRTAEQQAQDLLYKDLLPNFWEGGIVVFFHLYKTGGSSVTELIVDLKGEEKYDFKQAGCGTVKQEKRKQAIKDARREAGLTDDTDTDTTTNNNNETECHSRVVFINQRTSMTMEDATKSVWLAKHKHKVVIYNFHVEFPRTMYPTLIEAQPILDEWRDYAEIQDVPFFVSTILREPLGHALSFFNFFHVAVDPEESAWSPFVGEMEPTEENFLKTYVPNRLCHIMYDDAHAILQAPSAALRPGLVDELHHFMDDDELHRRVDFDTKPPRICDIDKVREVLNNSFDYIGVTENITPTILPIITYLAWGDASWAEDAEQKKNVDNFLGPPDELTEEEIAEEAEYEGPEEEPEEIVLPLKKHHLSDATKAHVLQESSLDQQLYEEYRDKYAHWPTYQRLLAVVDTTAATENENENETGDDTGEGSSESLHESESSSESDEL